MADETPEQQLTTAIRAHLGDSKPATDGLLIALAQSVRNRREHAHPTWEDLFCMNLDAWSGERMGVVLRRLADTLDERDQARGIAVALEQENARLTADLQQARVNALREAADVAARHVRADHPDCGPCSMAGVIADGLRQRADIEEDDRA